MAIEKVEESIISLYFRSQEEAKKYIENGRKKGKNMKLVPREGMWGIQETNVEEVYKPDQGER